MVLNRRLFFDDAVARASFKKALRRGAFLTASLASPFISSSLCAGWQFYESFRLISPTITFCCSVGVSCAYHTCTKDVNASRTRDSSPAFSWSANPSSKKGRLYS